jgi:DNA-binding NarL/FixJ family response regulator
VRILITDDHKIVREGLIEIIKQLPSVTTIEEACDGSGALSMSSELVYDLILLDISLPDYNGLEVLEKIIKRNADQKVLMLSMHPQEQYAIRSLQLGASGYLTKDTAGDELIAAIKAVTSGSKYITSSLAQSIARHVDSDFTKQLHESLSQREFSVFINIASGKSLREISDILCISDKTVSTYRSRIMEKMRMRRNAEITEYCIRNGLI